MRGEMGRARSAHPALITGSGCRSEEVNIQALLYPRSGRARSGAGLQLVDGSEIHCHTPTQVLWVSSTPMKLSSKGLSSTELAKSNTWITTAQLAQQLSCTRWYIRSLQESKVLLPGRDYIRISRFIRWNPTQVAQSLLAASQVETVDSEYYEMRHG